MLNLKKLTVKLTEIDRSFFINKIRLTLKPKKD